MRNPGRERAGYAFVAASAIGYGFMPFFAAHAYRAGLNVTTLLFLRFSTAALLFAPLAVWHDLRGHRRPDGMVVRWRPRARVLAAVVTLGAVLYTSQAFLYFNTMRMVGPGLAALLLYLYPGLVAAGAMATGRLRPTWRVAAVLAVAFAGVALAVGKVDGGRVTLAGLAVGVATAVTYALYILAGDRLSAEVPSRTMALLLFASAAASFGTVGAVTGQLRFGFAPAGWWSVVGLALVCTILGIWCFFLGLVRVGPTHASLLSLLECVTAILVGVLLLGDPMAPLQWLGAAIVLVAAVAGARLTAVPEPVSPEADE